MLAVLQRVHYRDAQDESEHHAFPEIHKLCQAILDWLDEGSVLLRPAQRDFSRYAAELVRSVQGTSSEASLQALLRAAEQPQSSAK